MDIVDLFYNKSYENEINQKMLYYNYDFPEESVANYIQQIIAIPINILVERDIKADFAEAVMAKDVFQFSSLEDGTDGICRKLKDIANPGVTAIQAGKLLLSDGKKRTDIAYIKYGENHLKTAESLGLLFELTHTYFLSCMGTVYLNIDNDKKQRLITRLLMRNKLIARLIKASYCAPVNARQFLYMLSDSTYIRRRSNIKTIFRYLQNSPEYDFSYIVSRINLS